MIARVLPDSAPSAVDLLGPVEAAQAWKEARQNVAARKPAPAGVTGHRARPACSKPAAPPPPPRQPETFEFLDEDHQAARTWREIAEANLAALSLITALLDLQLREMRALRRVLGRGAAPAVSVSPSPELATLLSAISETLGDRQWTCEELFEEAEMGQNTEHAQLRAALRDLRMRTPRQLGAYLRRHVGESHCGRRLHRHPVNRVGSRRWSITHVASPA